MASPGDLALNLILKATNQTGTAFSEVASGLKGMSSPLGLVATAVAAATAALGVVGVISVKSAGDFQQSMTRLVTTAGEFPKNLKMVSDGVLSLSTETGTSAKQLAAGMYIIESAGHHGAEGLLVLRAAAEGAKAENADLTTVSNALATVLQDYHIPASSATSAMNGLIAAVSNGRTNLQAISAAMGNVLPIASAMGVSFPQVAGAISALTNSGMTAQRATMDLANAIRNLGAPSNIATKAMKSVGLSAQDLKDTLSNKGLAAAIQTIEDHVGKTFPKNSKDAVTAFKAIMGGATGYNVALVLGGAGMKTYTDDIAKITAAMQKGGKDIDNWNLVQGNFNFKMDQAKQAVEVLFIKIGTALLPVIGKVVSSITQSVVAFTDWESKSHIVENVASLLAVAIDNVVKFFQNLISTGSNIVAFFQKNEMAMAALKGAFVGVLAILIVGFAAWTIAAAQAAIATIAATWPIIAIGVAVAALAAIFIHFYETSAPFRQFIQGIEKDFQQLWSMIQSNFNPVMKEIGKVFDTEIMPILKKFGEYIATQFQPVWIQLLNTWQGQLVPAWNQLLKAIGPALPAFKALGEVILGVLVFSLGIFIASVTATIKAIALMLPGVIQAFGGIVEIITGSLNIVLGIIGFFTDLFTGHFDKLNKDLQTIWDGIVLAFKGLWDTLMGILSAAWGAISGLVGGFIDGIIAYFQTLYDTLIGHSIIPDMINGIMDWFTNLIDFIPSLIQKFTTIITTGFNTVLSSAKYLWQQMNLIFTTAWNLYLAKPLAAMLTDFTTWFGNLIKSSETWATNMMSGFGKNITSGTHFVTDALTNLGTNITKLLGFHSPPSSGPLSTSDQWMPNMMTMFANGITTNTSKVTLTVTRLATNISNQFKTIDTNVKTSTNNVDTSLAQMNTKTQQSTSGVNQNLQLLSTNITNSTTNINTQLQQLNTNTQTNLNGITTSVKDASKNIKAANQDTQNSMKDVSSTAQDTSQAVKAANEVVAVSTGEAADKVERAAQSMQTTFRNTRGDAQTTTVVIGQSMQDAQRNYYAGANDLKSASKDLSKGMNEDMFKNSQAFDHMKQGIEEGAKGLLEEVKSIADNIAMLLGHSVPEDGPLKDDDKWGGHFVDNLVNGMHAGIPRVQSAANALASAMAGGSLSSSMNISPLGVSSMGSSGQPMIIYMQVDKKTIGKVVTSYQQRELHVQGVVRGS